MVRIADAVGNDISAYRQLAGGTTTALMRMARRTRSADKSDLKWKWGRPASKQISDARSSSRLASQVANRPRGSGAAVSATRMGVEEVICKSFIDARDYMTAWDEYEAKLERKETAIPPRKKEVYL
jgi:hypothetical protein